MDNINFSIIIPWMSGNPQREEAFKNLLNCLKVQEPPTKDGEPIVFELIIVEQVTPDKIHEANKKLKEILPQEFAESKYIQLVNDSNNFNKSWCINVAAKQAYYEHLIVMDADSLFGKDYIRSIKDCIRNTNENLNKIIICWNKLICMPGRDNPITRYITPLNTCALGGIWYANKTYFFDKLGGMCENFDRAGGEDNDIYERALFTQKSPISIMPYTLVHQYHHWTNHYYEIDFLFDVTRQNCQTIIQRLKNTSVGNPEHPTFIDISDLPGGTS